MDRIFTPWRLQYLRAIHDGSGCVFCTALAAPDDARVYILDRGPDVFVILNIFPYSNGHVMVVPRRHVARLTDASPEARRNMIETAARCETILQRAYEPDGFNVGLNLGRAAGAGIAEHLHLHVVPRWDGDTNFSTVIGDTRFIPETPQQTYDRLAPLFRTAN
ncbi:MAG: HIT domain-containing protein [Acidobacteriota bacterium]